MPHNRCVIAEGAIETITQDGHAAMIVMSPERYDFLVHAAERGHIWREAIRAYGAGVRGVPAEEAIQEIADELGVELLPRGWTSLARIMCKKKRRASDPLAATT
jgi:hypothetical protein